MKARGWRTILPSAEQAAKRLRNGEIGLQCIQNGRKQLFVRQHLQFWRQTGDYRIGWPVLARDCRFSIRNTEAGEVLPPVGRVDNVYSERNLFGNYAPDSDLAPEKRIPCRVVQFR